MPPKRKSSAANANTSKKHKVELQITPSVEKRKEAKNQKQAKRTAKTPDEFKEGRETAKKLDHTEGKFKTQNETQVKLGKQLKTNIKTQVKLKAEVKTSGKVKAADKSSKEKPDKIQITGLKTNTCPVLGDLFVDQEWKAALGAEFQQDYFKEIEANLQQEYSKGKQIFPPREQIFNAFNLTPLSEVKVLILGQDPYHDDNQAMGLSFSVPRGEKIPPSLKNIYKELERDPKIVGFTQPDHGCLLDWAKRGVLLLNATLTVEAHLPNSHAKLGWQTFTDNVIKTVSDRCLHVVFILWGNFAHKKDKLIDGTKHAIIKTAHPSPLSFNKFNACNCFSDCNSALQVFGLSPIDWSL